MEKTCSSSGPKVSQIATLFQKKPTEMTQESVQKESQQQQHHHHHHHHNQQLQQTNPAVVRTESHAARFNNARALFEKLGVDNHPRPAAFTVKMMANSTSREDIVDVDLPPSPKRKSLPPAEKNITNGLTQKESGKLLHNLSRNKNEKPEKPEKPERKFNSKELIEKQKNWTSHFTTNKTRSTRFNSDPNRCDIIRTVPGTALISAGEIVHKEKDSRIGYNTRSPLDSPPSPPVRQPPPPPPEIKPRNIKTNIVTSPVKLPPVLPPNKPQNLIRTSPTKCPDGLRSPTKTSAYITPSYLSKDEDDELPELPRKKSLDENKFDNRCTEKETLITSPGHGISSSPSPAQSASSGPSSPIHTEDEKQENEATEKDDRFDDEKGKPNVSIFDF